MFSQDLTLLFISFIIDNKSQYWEGFMCVALIGGMDRLERQYMDEAEKFGINLRVFTKPKAGIASKIKNVDAVLIFTNKVSHRAKKEVMAIAKTRDIPIFMYHSCGICTIRDSFSCLKNNVKGRSHVGNGN